MKKILWNHPEVDALLEGKLPKDEDLARLAPLMIALRAQGATQPSESRTAAFVTQLSTAATTQGAYGAESSLAMNWKKRAAAVAAFALVGTLGVAGAAAADDAAPGDALYALDVALESVGVGDGGTEERIDEALELAEEGHEEEALEHAAEALEEEGDSESSAALLAVAEKLLAKENGNSAETHAAVAAMLTWMAETDATGKEFGQGVSEHARLIGGKPDKASDSDDDTSVDADVEGDDGTKPGNGGKPDDAGRPDDAGKPDSAGKPEGARKPDKPGKK